MFGIIGIAFVFVLVFGGYLAAGGSMGIIGHALRIDANDEAAREGLERARGRAG